HAEGDRVGPRRSEREIDELKHRFEILARSATAKPLLRLADVGSDRDPGAGENLVQVDALEIAETALSDDLAGGFSRDEVLVAGQSRAVLLGRADDDEAVTIGDPRLGQAVDLCNRDLRQETLIQAVLVDDPRNRLALDEVAHELVGQRPGGALVLLDDRPLEKSLQIQPVP